MDESSPNPTAPTLSTTTNTSPPTSTSSSISPSPLDHLSLRGASENNLKNIDLDLPHDRMVVVTGLSGSGKSSLAFDTIYAEGQRRYVETFSPYTRQFLKKLKTPQLESIQGVRPALAIQQRNRVVGSRSTVGTLTGINDYLKIVWRNLAAASCPRCNIPIDRYSAPELATRLLELAAARPDHRWAICGRVAVTTPEMLATETATLLERGYGRIIDLVGGEILELESSSIRSFPTTLHVVIDRCRGTDIEHRRLVEAVEQALGMGERVCVVVDLASVTSTRPLTTVSTGTGANSFTKSRLRTRVFPAEPHCDLGPLNIPPPTPGLFSFNHPAGACPQCRGFGHILALDLSVVIPDPTKSIAAGALACWNTPSTKGELRSLINLCAKHNIPIDIPWQKLSKDQQQVILKTKSRNYWGIYPWFEWLEKRTYKMHVRVYLSKYRSQVLCPECDGRRLREHALAYKIDGKTISDIWLMPVGELLQWLDSGIIAQEQLSRPLQEILNGLRSRLGYLCELGLSYLTLDRPARSLSGGETQRVNLTTALGSELVSTQFVLDEPSVGLHPRDTAKLITAMTELARKGNSVVVVEHDLDVLAAGDYVVELGPGSGANGGKITFAGPITGWHGIDSGCGAPAHQELPPPTKYLTLNNANSRNLKALSLDIPLERLVVLAGVSGSGKSTLAKEIIETGWRLFQTGRAQEAEFGIDGFQELEQVLVIDQSPLAKSTRANIATYTGVWEILRSMLAATEDAKRRGLGKSAFSFNVDGGRCPACKGAGFVIEDMQFLSDVTIPCELCLGARFQPIVREVKLQECSVDELLNLTVVDCATLFHAVPKIAGATEVLLQLGLGHLRLGHALSDLSGGEAQRLKLVPFVTESSSKRSLLIFDEPTTGLHLYDVYRLIELMRLLRGRGHSILCIEHNLAVIEYADYVIELGPEGGDAGGHLLFSGSPYELASKNSPTGCFLGGKNKAGSAAKDSYNVYTLLDSPDVTDKAVEIRGASEHNLKNIDLSVPLGKFVVITGVSGSGKSSIARDIIFAEGQRRYLDCLSPYARQFVKDLARPDIVSITNIPPTICVEQHTFQPSSLSTVGTVSEAYHFLRLLFSKIGTQYCLDHPDQPIGGGSPDDIASALQAASNSTVRILAPIIKQKKGIHHDVLERAIALEIGEVRVDGVIGKPTQFIGELKRHSPHSIDFVMGKFNPSRIDRDILSESIAHTLALSQGELIALGDVEERLYSTARACPICGRGHFRPDPEDFSFQSRRGKCTTCSGTGQNAKGKACRACHGSRLNPIGRSVLLAGKHIHEIAALPATEAFHLLRGLVIAPRESHIAQPILRELGSKLGVLQQLGLDYLPLARDCATLSGGELQRLRLAAAMGSPLTGALYVLDEPSAGLHPLDNQRVLTEIRSLTHRGNSVLVIEHDLETIIAADHIIEVGPGGGREGGNIVFTGSPIGILRQRQTATGKALASELPALRDASQGTTNYLTIARASCHNVEIANLKVPLQQLVTIAGVSGSGKSTLLHSIIYDTLNPGSTELTTWRSTKSEIKSTMPIGRVLLVDQKPLGANARSTPASYLKIFDQIRKLFANLPAAKERGYKDSYFSYNTGKGRCPTCNGLGRIKLEMNFLADARVSCDSCNGSRYTEEAQSILFSGRSISEVMQLTFDEARSLFTHHRNIIHVLKRACELGLGYLTLGQDASTLSGGESQRLKLVSELSKRSRSHTLYILDEPTTGLHRADVVKLMTTLRELVTLGHSVMLIEHEPLVLAESDFVVELGPGAAEKGGRVIFSGPPAELVNQATPWAKILSEAANTAISDHVVSASPAKAAIAEEIGAP